MAEPIRPTVTTEHDDFKRLKPLWERCRDAAAGQQAVHDKATVYLPKLSEQSEEDYLAYRLRANFFNATWRTIDGLKGMIFRRPPTVETPASIKELLDDVDLEGTPFNLFCEQTVEEVLTVGLVGVLVDFPLAEPTATRADALPLNLRPTMTKYRVESVINRKRIQQANKTVLGLVVLKECYTEPVDEFRDKKGDQYRVLDLTTGVYRVRIFRIDDKGEQYQVGTDMIPQMNGKPLPFIPFYPQGEWEEPPLIDLVDLNFSHYRTTADYEHGCHFTGLPTPVVSGYSPATPGEKLYIGSTTAWIFKDPLAKASFLEFSGSGMTVLEKNLAGKEARMAVLGARMLEAQKREVETAEVAAVHRSGENSMLSTLAQKLSLSLRAALQVFSDWGGGSGKVECELNRDFYPVPMSPLELAELVKAWQAGALSKQALFDKLQQREIIAKDKTFEDHEAEIEAEGPKMTPGLGAFPPLGGTMEDMETEELDESGKPKKKAGVPAK